MPTETIVSIQLEENQIIEKIPKKPKRPSWLIFCAIGLCLLVLVGALVAVFYSKQKNLAEVASQTEEELPLFIQSDLLGIDGDSRTGEKLEAVRAIAVHYVANPGSTAKQNRDYFDNPVSHTSAHFIVGLEGEVIQCVPLDEKSFATNHRNIDTISIEVCHPDETGKFLPATRQSLVRLLSALMKKFNLEKEDIIRHYDVTGKMCPLYYVQNPEAWLLLREDAAQWHETSNAIYFE